MDYQLKIWNPEQEKPELTTTRSFVSLHLAKKVYQEQLEKKYPVIGDWERKNHSKIGECYVLNLGDKEATLSSIPI